MKVEIYYSDFSDCGWQRPENQHKVDALIGSLSKKRQEKIAFYQPNGAKFQSLAAGLLLDYGLQRHGISEKMANIRTGKQGKPYLADVPGLYFNLSHSGNCVMLVLSDRECGCDIQKVGPARLRVAERFFTVKEADKIRQCGTSIKQDTLFCTIWALKESYIKMTGQGIAAPLDRFCVLEGERPGGCIFRSYELFGYVAAVCVSLNEDDENVDGLPDLVFCPFQNLSDMVL